MVDRLLERVWEYDSVSRRRVRSLWRTADAVARTRSSRPAILPAYWWDGHPNFGDALTPWVLARYGIVAVHTPPERARVVGIGSLIEQLPGDFAGQLWGTGMLYGEQTALPDATPLALRGPLSHSALGVDLEIPLGDPGLLIGRFARRRRPRWRLGIIPHGLHERDQVLADVADRAGTSGTMIDVRWPPSMVIDRIARCAAVLSTSLHGVVVADALGVPAMWTQRPPMLWGGDVKFRDYEAVVTPGRTRQVLDIRGMSVTQLIAAAGVADPRAVTHAIQSVEATIPHLPVVRDRPWLINGYR